ncbi:MAG: serine/threonine-protein phosphatase [Nocardioidaceae bacterium]|nr:serine/threonine-protein phosphatase [Nocardioidaceae bacterium]MCL2612165.1 serine/threonine-protein phosphatase [Nocardioidaceae bacterium]
MTEAAAPEETLAAMRARLQEQCRVPPLPTDWEWASAMVSAEGLDFGGDFFVAAPLQTSEGPGLQMVLVDVCGNGAKALPAATRLADTIRGLVATQPYDGVMPAVSAHLNALEDPEAFATACQVVLSFTTGRYEIRSAGHPPVLRWDSAAGEWSIDSARGMALGIQDSPELHHSAGTLAPDEGLLFYTDGVVETRTSDFDEGVEWLRDVARSELRQGWPGLAGRLLADVTQGADDRAVLVLRRCRGI